MRGTGGALAQKGGVVLLLVSAASRGFCMEAKRGREEEKEKGWWRRRGNPRPERLRRLRFHGHSVHAYRGYSSIKHGGVFISYSSYFHYLKFKKLFFLVNTGRIYASTSDLVMFLVLLFT